MKLFKPVALVAVGLMIGGAFTAKAATETNPVTLCVRSGAVVRVADTCTSRETQIDVASQADVAALAVRMDADDAADAALAAQVASLADQVSSLAAQVASQDALLDELTKLLPGELTLTVSTDGTVVTVEGRRLQPGSSVRIIESRPVGGPLTWERFAASDGTISAQIQPNCNLGPADIFASGIDQTGAPVSQSQSVVACLPQ